VQTKDAIGRTWQMSTIQLDLNLPERFGLEYTAADGSRKRPVMIHRALFGSIERSSGAHDIRASATAHGGSSPAACGSRRRRCTLTRTARQIQSSWMVDICQVRPIASLVCTEISARRTRRHRIVEQLQTGRLGAPAGRRWTAPHFVSADVLLLVAGGQLE